VIEHYIDAVSSYAGDIDDLIFHVTWITTLWFVAAQVLLFGLVIKFKAKDGVRSQYISGEEHHQMQWIEWPHRAVLLFDIFIIYAAITVWYDVKQNLPEPDAEVRIIGQQWSWTFTHPGPDGKFDTEDDIDEVDQLHIASDKIYNYHLEAMDVMHSFSVPVFRLKQDAIPGRTITGWWKAEKNGEWSIQCAEMCGIGHGIMGARIIIESPEAHATWMAKQGGVAVANATR
jgi:cytochrome c oxidase subunit 2